MLDPVLRTRLREERKVPRYVAALLEGLQFGKADFGPMRLLAAPEWDEVLSFSDRAHLTLQLSQLPSDVLPAWVGSRIQQNVADNTKRTERIKAVYQEAAHALNVANAGHIVIKGFTQYPDYTKSPNLRMQSDIDMYCPANSILCARDALQRIGYESTYRQRHVQVDHLPAMIRERGWRWRGNAFDPEMPPAIELHYCLWNERAARFGIPGVEKFWARRIEREIGGLTFPALDPVDHIAFCSLHVLRSLLRGDWIIHHVYELAYFLNAHANDEPLWRSWEQTHSDSLRSTEAISFCLARMWFGCATSAAVERTIDELPMAIRQWFRCFGSSFLEIMFTPNRDGTWLHVALLQSTGARLFAIRRGLLPARIPPLWVADHAPSVNRTIVEPKYSWRSLRYCAYIAARAGFYGRVFLRGVFSGIRWYHSQRTWTGCKDVQ